MKTTTFLSIIFVMGATLLHTHAMANGNEKIQQTFVSAPQLVFPTLFDSMKLDMIDYYNSGMDKSSTNLYEGQSRITSIAPQSLTVELSPASHSQIALLPSSADTLVMVLHTLLVPGADSQLTIYTSDWSKNITSRHFTQPDFALWLTADGKKHADKVDAMVPFLLVGYEYNPETQTLTLTNNVEQCLSKEAYRDVKDYLLTSLQYKWDGHKFQLLK